MLSFFTDLRLLSDMGKYLRFTWDRPLTLFLPRRPEIPRDALGSSFRILVPHMPRHYIRRAHRLLCLVSAIGTAFGNHGGYIQSSLRRRFSFAGLGFSSILKVAVVPGIFVLWFGSGTTTCDPDGDGDFAVSRLCEYRQRTGTTEPDLETCSKRLAHPSGQSW